MSNENWDEFRTAFQVARIGTVSGAAEVLGVHHATVIRHIDSLEADLGVKLFQRHARGYTATEAGEDLMHVATTTDDQFTQLVSRIKGRGNEVTGELIVTTVAGLSHIVTPILARFQRQHPDTRIRYVSDERLFRLEYGEAHVAIRAGKAPEEPDNVVQPYLTIPAHLCAAQSYVRKYGLPNNSTDFGKHRFVAAEGESARAPVHQWMQVNIPAQNIVLRATEAETRKTAICEGMGIGFLMGFERSEYPDLVDVLAPRPEWESPLWLVSHVDLHRTNKVQALLTALKDGAKQWSGG